MANAEPSQSVISGTSGAATARSSTQYRPSLHSAQGSINPSSPGLSSLSSRHSSLLAPKAGTSAAHTRRRLRSVDALDTLPDHSCSNPPHHSASKVVPHAARDVRPDPTDNKGKAPAHVEFETNMGDSGEPGAFSDEYDLSREDPRILQEVQRALVLKARREARIQSGQSPPRMESAPKSDIASRSSNSSPRRLLFPSLVPETLPQTEGDVVAETEIDFRPSTGLPSSASLLHPVPTSPNGGTLLDWSSTSLHDEKQERRWTLSITKRKDKDKLPILQSRSMEEQDSLYAQKIAKIKARASVRTLRKAEITSEQLRRRYNALYGTLVSGTTPLNLSAVARWYGSQEADFRRLAEKAEPFTWLKHLDKRGTKPSNRLHWHLSALIVEQYVHSHGLSDWPDRAASVEPLLPSDLVSRPSPTHMSSWSSLGPEAPRTHSPKAQVSFDPLVDSPRNSIDLRKSIESPSRIHRHSLPTRTESLRDSIRSGFSISSQQNPVGGSSPASSLLHIRDLAQRIRRRNPLGSDDALSSARNSISERSEDDNKKAANIKDQNPVDTRSGQEMSGAGTGIKFIISGDPSETQEGQQPSITGNEPSNAQSRAISDGELAPEPQPGPPGANHRVLGRRRVKTSLPSSDKLSLRRKQLRQLEVDEEKASREYELKAQLLDDTIAHNNRIRQLLNRVAAGVREYDMIQCNLSKSLGLTYRNLPPELLDAFSHDPAIVSGTTRRSQGWRAVEDTHHRLARQRDILQTFLSTTANTSVFSPPGSVLHEPITTLLRSLEALEGLKEDIAVKTMEVAESLAKVKTVHATVKKEYNETLSHTSVMYPELTHIVALEESYKDQYQQFWEFGLDALTILLDTVTPFWRHYGKTIGEDVQDFLVIPLYRNEFTGESKRYPIENFPRRSFRHWIGLILFFALAVAVTWLQARAAVTSIIHFRLRWITHGGIRWLVMPFFWIGIFIQWAAVLTELCVVIAQLGVVTWWIGWAIKVFT